MQRRVIIFIGVSLFLCICAQYLWNQLSDYLQVTSLNTLMNSVISGHLSPGSHNGNADL